MLGDESFRNLEVESSLVLKDAFEGNNEVE